MIQNVFNWAVSSIQGVGSWAYEAIANTSIYITNLVK